MKFLWPLFFLFLACGKEAAFLHHYTPVADQEVHAVRKIKEMRIEGSRDVDILWIIDNSGSMDPHHKNIIKNTQIFIDEFSRTTQLQWRMGLISTDKSDAPYLGISPPYFDWKSPTPTSTFQYAVGRLGLAGNGYEETFYPISNTLTRNPSFLRKDAWLILISVTDAPEQSSSINAQALLQQLDALKGLKKVKMYGVFGAQDLGCARYPSEDAFNYKGSPYETVINATGGSIFPVCSPDFGQNLSILGSQITQLITYPRLTLPQRPKLSTLTVSYKGRSLPGGPKVSGGLWFYDYSSNSVVFYDLNFAAGEEEEVEIFYLEDNGY